MATETLEPGQWNSQVTPQVFRDQMAKLGITLSPEENTALFQLMDTDGSGNLDIWELVMAITPPDYPGGSANYHWRKRTNEMEQDYLEQCAEGPGAGLRAFVEEQKQKHLTSWGWSLEEIIERLRIKLDQKTTRGGKCYRMFDRKRGGGGIDQEDFQTVCAELGFVLSKEDVARFFSIHDKDGDVVFVTNRANQARYVLYNFGSEPQRGLIEQEHFGT